MAVYLRVRLRRVATRQTSLLRAAESILASVGESHSELSLELVGDRRMRRYVLGALILMTCGYGLAC